VVALSVDDIILKIHAAPLEPQGWQDVMRSLMDLCEAEHALMLTVGASRVPKIEAWEPSVDFNPDALVDYAENWGSQDLLYINARRKGRIQPGLVSTESQLVGAREYSDSPYFNEFCKPHNLHSHLNVCLTNGMPELGLGPSAITLYRGDGRESFAEAETTLLQRLAPHLSLATRTSWHLKALGMHESMFRRALDEIRIPLFALDVTGRILLVNSAGDGLLRANRWIAVKQKNLGTSSGLLSPEAFRQALAKLRSGTGMSLLLTDGVSGQQAIMTTVPLGHSSSLQAAHENISGLVWIVPCVTEAATVKNLGQLFQLTPAEVRLLQRLVDGNRLSDAAAHMHVTLNTVRSQLKSIFRKTGQRTQGQLLALATRMAIIRAEA
jgi:DNA-binding CsgD family transcriptional regulator